MKELKPYIFKFEEKSLIEAKISLSNCNIKGLN